MSEDLKFLFPLDGDFVNEYDGTITGGKLEIVVKFTAVQGKEYSVNGVAAAFKDGVYSAKISLSGYETPVRVCARDGSCLKSINVYWLKNANKTYRLSLDDNIWCFRDIAGKRYKSIFENPYMGFYKHLYDTYGTKVHFNVFYQTDNFDLSQMPDIYKSEWKENSNWLKLTFHALQEMPDEPYKNTTYDKIKRHCEMITDQIIRFAGEDSLSPYTTVHWGAVNREGCLALRDFGFKGLAGYFDYVNGKPIVSYYLNDDQVAHLNGRDIWKDTETGLIFFKNDMVINLYKREQIIPLLDELEKNSHKSGFIELMIHEQYFHPAYFAYQPDYREKVEDAIKWVHERGYRPTLLKELIENG